VGDEGISSAKLAKLRERVRQLEEEREELIDHALESEGRYRDLFHSMLDGYALHEMIYDNEGAPVDYRFLEVNPAFERLTGLDARDLVGRTLLEALPGSESYWIETYGKVARDGGTIRFENYFEPLDRHYEVVAYQPKPDHFACAFTDVTERRKLEEQVRHAQKMEAVGTLAGGVAHDFNNLLTGILGYANVLKLRAEPDDPVYKGADVIERAAERAAELSQQLLGFARKGKLQERPVDLRRVTADVVAIVSRTLDKRIDISQRTDGSEAVVSGDPGQLQQVLMNLAVNAADAMPDGGELTFGIRLVELDEAYCRTHPDATPGTYLQLSVSDTGVGIPEDVQDRIFEPFFTTKEPGKGTGMGLATTYGIVRNHEGFIQVYSEPGKGTTFKVYLPPNDDDDAPEWADMPSEEAYHGHGSLLVVDDEETVCQTVAEMLAEIGYDVKWVTSGREAVEIYDRFGSIIDLVILDWAMPEMSGEECFLALQALDPDVRALLVTGHAFNGAAQQLMDQGMIGFAQKPFVMGDLAKAVALALRRDD
jgi:two-component system, cell cycle sensor histidine kinase and response regulator CckA